MEYQVIPLNDEYNLIRFRYFLTYYQFTVKRSEPFSYVSYLLKKEIARIKKESLKK